MHLLEEEVEEMRSGMDAALEGGLPRLFLIESEHELVLREAELAWARDLSRKIAAGTLSGMEGWRVFHAGEEAGR